MNNTHVIITDNEEQTERLAQRISVLLKAGDVIAFKGDLGAGKTTFVRGLAKGMQSRDLVSSPTFVLMHIYNGRLPIYHFDAYRLKSAEDLWNIGAEDYIFGDGVAVIEWSEIVSEILPLDHLEINITSDSKKPKMRTFTFSSFASRGEELLETIKKW